MRSGGQFTPPRTCSLFPLRCEKSPTPPPVSNAHRAEMPKKEFILGKPSRPVFHSEAWDSQQHASLCGTGLDSWVFLFAHNTMCFRHLGSADCWPARYSAVRGPRQHSWGRLLSRRRSQICPQVVFKRRHIAKAIVKSFPDFHPCQIRFLKYRAA